MKGRADLVIPPYFVSPSLMKPLPVRTIVLYRVAITGASRHDLKIQPHRSETIFVLFPITCFHLTRLSKNSSSRVLFSSSRLDHSNELPRESQYQKYKFIFYLQPVNKRCRFDLVIILSVANESIDRKRLSMCALSYLPNRLTLPVFRTIFNSIDCFCAL